MKFRLINAIVLSAALSGNVWADLNDGLVAYYPFDGNAEDESGNGNDGTVNGATLIDDRFGNQKSAYNFDGVNDSISVDDGSQFNFSNHLSLSLWVKPRVSQKNSYAGLIDKSHSHNSNNGVVKSWILQQNDRITNNFGFGYCYNNSCVSTKNAISLDTNIWNHLFISKANKVVKVYKNGILISTYQNSVSSIDTNGTLPLIIGSVNNWNRFFNGIIDDIRIYNRALSESEIQQLYKAEEEENEKLPIEISSKAVYDSKTKTLSLEGILVPFIDEFTGKETDNKGIFEVQLEEKTKLVFELIPWSINFKDMFEGKETSGYILYDYKTRSVDIPCFEVTTIAKLGDGIEGEAIYYKDVIMKQRHIDYPIFHVEDMTETDSCN